MRNPLRLPLAVLPWAKVVLVEVLSVRAPKMGGDKEWGGVRWSQRPGAEVSGQFCRLNPEVSAPSLL